jgi:hypothetical protein
MSRAPEGAAADKNVLTETRVARFFLVKHTKKGIIYQTTIKYTKQP